MQFITYAPAIINGHENVVASRVFYSPSYLMEWVGTVNGLSGSECLLLVGLHWHDLPE